MSIVLAECDATRGPAALGPWLLQSVTGAIPEANQWTRRKPRSPTERNAADMPGSDAAVETW
jgi:hypothetical protein